MIYTKIYTSFIDKGCKIPNMYLSKNKLCIYALYGLLFESFCVCKFNWHTESFLMWMHMFPMCCVPGTMVKASS